MKMRCWDSLIRSVDSLCEGRVSAFYYLTSDKCCVLPNFCQF